MAWLAIDKKGRETISENKPVFDGCEWYDEIETSVECELFSYISTIQLKEGTIYKIIGRKITFEDSPIEL